MNAQGELFEPLLENQGRPDCGGGHLTAQVRLGEKVIPFPITTWKDDRTRADLSGYGAGVTISRNLENLANNVASRLMPIFGNEVRAAVLEEFERLKPQMPKKIARKSNKLQKSTEAGGKTEYLNPWGPEAKEWKFSKSFHWLRRRPEPTQSEKDVYAALLFPSTISTRWDSGLGVILGLDQGALAEELGISRKAVNAALRSLRSRRLIESTGNPGSKQSIRFLKHEWMPKACPKTLQDLAQPDTIPRKTCNLKLQVPEDIEIGESGREARLIDFLQQTVLPKFPAWSLDQLKSEWKRHSSKGNSTGKWAPGDRKHFLKAWMPNAWRPDVADSSRRSSPNLIEPPRWRDFLNASHKGARDMPFRDVMKRDYGKNMLEEYYQWEKGLAQKA